MKKRGSFPRFYYEIVYMDKNTITGFVLIFLILIGFGYFNKPSKEEKEAMQRRKDSLELVKAKEVKLAQEQQLPVTTEEQVLDSAAAQARYGVFSNQLAKEDEFITLENNLMKVKVSTKGGRIYSAELKNYQRFDSLPLVLFEGEKSKFNLRFFAENKIIETKDLYFAPNTRGSSLSVAGPKVPKGQEGRVKFNEDKPGESKSLTLRLDAGDGRYIDYVYTIRHNSYLIDFNIKTKGMNELMATNSLMSLDWAIKVPRQEKKSKYGEDNHTSIYYKFHADEVEDLGTQKSANESLRTKTDWIGYKQLFFASVLMADNSFPSAEISMEVSPDDDKYLADFESDITLPFEGKYEETIPLKFYFGPNHYRTLKQYDNKMEDMIGLGWGIFGWVNKIIVIPVFNFLRKYISNFGVIILLLTIFIKVIIFPFTFKSYQSQAKMKALKPELDEIQKKFPKEKAMEQQQATMALYKKAGVNPASGCLPMLFQMPILFAMFRFFPVSIELRQQSFLWAHDLSTYDSIFNLPFTIPFYGDHVSLFCLLMTGATLLYTKMNSEMSAGTSQMPGMKMMMYFMPVMFLFIFNNYSAGLSYYYFLSNLITFGQMFLVRRMIDEDKIHAQIKANKKKPAKKSKFQQRLEDIARQQQQAAKRK